MSTDSIRSPSMPASPTTRPPAQSPLRSTRPRPSGRPSRASTTASATRAPAIRRAARSKRTWPRWRARATASRSPAAWPPSTTCCRCCARGDHVVSTQDLYGGAWRIFTKVFAHFGVDFTFVDTSDAGGDRGGDPAGDEAALAGDAVESAAEVTDIAACAAIARGRRSAPSSTTPSPRRCCSSRSRSARTSSSTRRRSTSTATATPSAARSSPNDEALFDELKFLQNAIGAVPGPQDCFLILRGMKTLGLRVERHCSNAELLAKYLLAHDRVRRVYYPGLVDQPTTPSRGGR